MKTSFQKGKELESRRRYYWNGRSDVLDVHSDTYGPTDLAVIFKQYANRETPVLVVEVKMNGYLETEERHNLKEFLDYKPDAVGLRIEYLKDPDGGYGQGNTTYTELKTPDDVDRHREKIKQR
jgi:hypothetical protein